MRAVYASLAVAFVLLSTGALAAQRPGGTWGGSTPGITGSITGQVVDAGTGEPVEFATLVLKRPAAPAGAPGRTEGGPGAGMSDSARQAMMVERMTERLGRAPTEAELAEARQRMSARAAGGPPQAGATPGQPVQVDGTITDEQGRFTFEEVALGTYLIEASFIGYETSKVADVTLTGKQPDLKLANIALGTSAAMLEQVVVTGEAALIENRVDKIVYNASQDVVNQGGDGSDVLRRVPLLTVDIDGNVSLRGSTQIQILINGRPSTMFAGSVGEALQAMPADQIEKVEVITSPGARYQGEGTAGIINIITKRGGLKGLTGNADASIGTRSNNASLNLAYTKGRFGINGGAGSRFSWPRESTTSFLRTDTLGGGALRTLTQNGAGEGVYNSINGNVGAFYDVNAFNSFNTSLRVSGRQRNSITDNVSVLDSPSEGIFQRYLSRRESFNPGINYDWTTDYKRKFKGEDHELNVAFQVGASTRNSDYELVQTSVEGNFGDRDEIGNNEGLNLEYTLQADYQAPLSKKLFVETGAQGILRDLTSDYEFLNRVNGGEEYVRSARRSNVFAYNQDVYAGYLSLRNTFTDKWSAVAGMRYEATAISGSQERTDSIPAFANDYGNLLPSASVQYKVNQSSNLRLGYSRRIRRPGLGDINPFINQVDPRVINYGNPELEPEVSDQLELTGNTRVGGGFVNGSLFYRQTSGLISEFLDVDEAGITRSFPINLGTTDSYGANAFVSYTIAKIVKLRGGVNAEHLTLIGAGNLAGLERNVWQYNFNGSFTIELPKKLVVEGFGFYRAPEQSIQGRRASFSIWSIGAQKKLMEDRWRVGVRIVEPFAKFKTFPNSLSGEGFRQDNTFSVLFRSFGLSASYRFGALRENRQGGRRSRIDNNDQRSEGGGEFYPHARPAAKRARAGGGPTARWGDLA